jgi:hypothetical protein
MSKSKKTTPKKKVALKKKKHPKPPPSHFEFWFSYGFLKGDVSSPGKTKAQIEQIYSDYLAQWDAEHGQYHQIKFTWEQSGHPKVYTLIADINPAPVPIPHPPPEGGSISPPQPPPPPPPSLS